MMLIFLGQMGLYSPNSTEWNQIGHDYKKSRRAPLKCKTPASISRIWTIRESSNSVYNLVYDRNNDGYTEVLALSDSIVLRNATNGNYIFGVPSSGTQYVGSKYVAVGKAGNSRRIFLQEPNNCLIRVRDGSNGNLIYSYNFCSYIDVFPTIIDYNNDNCAEILTGVGNNAVMLNLCSNNYSPLWQVNTRGVYKTIAVGTFNGTLSAVVLSRDSGNIFIIRVNDGSILAKYNIFTKNASSSWTTGPLVWDINNDGNDEIFFGYKSNNVYYMRAINVSNNWSYNDLWVRSGSNYQPASFASFLAIGKILSGGQWGIAFSGALQKVHVIRATDGSIITTNIPNVIDDYVRGDPSIGDINGDGIEGVVFSTYCGKPTEYSYVNNWSSAVWQADLCANDPPITSDLIIAKYYMNYNQNPPQGQIIIVEGDYSCYTNVWLCQGGEETTPLNSSESKNNLTITQIKNYEIIVYSNKSINLYVYNALGRRVKEIVLKEGLNNIKLENRGVYFLDFGKYGKKKVLITGD